MRRQATCVLAAVILRGLATKNLGLGTSAHWVGTVPPMAGLLRLVCAIPPSEPDVRLSPHPALHQMG